MNDPLSITATLLLATLLLAGCGSRTPEATATVAAPGASASAAAAMHDDDSVQLTPAQLEAAGIEMATAGPARIRDTLGVYGTIVPDAEHLREVSARFPGVIREVRVRIGDTVRQGQTLATVESNESLRTYEVTAPLTGVITARDANPGEQTGERRLFTVTDLSSVWVELSLFPRDRARVQLGQVVQVRSPDAGLVAEGRVVHVAPFGSSASQTLTARVQLANPRRQWAPGLYVNADIVLFENMVPLAVCNEALQVMDGRGSVFVEEAPGRFVAHPVQTGRRDGAMTEITAGLSAGQRYACANSFILKAQAGIGTASHEH